MRMVERQGIDPDRALEALAAGPGSSRAITAKGPAIARGTFGPPARFPLRLAHKDAGLARAMGGGPVSDLVETLYADALAEGRGDQDYSAVAARR
jgi:3-hydroxyisobutyrate dehydrogenase-like beta-hydroxyacid dehydrogenase